MSKQENQELIDAINELNYSLEKLSSGEMWGGTLVDAINELAKATDKNHWARKPMSRRGFFKTILGKK